MRSQFLIVKEHNLSICQFNERDVLLSTGHALLGHVINVCTGNDLVCGLECLRNGRCRSYNCFPAENQSAEICHLNNETRTSRPKDFKGNQRTTYFELMQVYIIIMLLKVK